MKLNELMAVAGSRISGGAEFLWNCYPDSRYLDFNDTDDNEVCTAIFSHKTSDVYEITVTSYDTNVVYRWTDPAWVDARTAEANFRGIEANIAYDEVKYTDVSESDILCYANSFINNETDKANDETVDDDETVDENETFDKNEYHEETKTEYTVKISVTDIIEVKATSMENAIELAKEFSLGMKPTSYPGKVAWIDRYLVKEEISRDLVTEVYQS